MPDQPSRLPVHVYAAPVRGCALSFCPYPEQLIHPGDRVVNSTHGDRVAHVWCYHKNLNDLLVMFRSLPLP